MNKQADRAIFEFRQWVHKLRGPEMARNAGDPIPELDAMETKTSAEAVDKFVELFPHYAEFKNEITASHTLPIRTAAKLWNTR